MTKQLGELATKTDDLSSIFKIYREEGENRLLQAIYYLRMHAIASTHFHTKYYKHFKEKIIMKIIMTFRNVQIFSIIFILT